MGPILNGGSPHRRLAIEGQSNSVGQGSTGELAVDPLAQDTGLTALAAADFARVYIFNPTTSAYEKLRIESNNLGNDGSSFGPEFGIAVRWMRETIRGNLYIDKHGVNGQPISYYQQGTQYFNDALARCAAQNVWLKARGISARNIGWLHVQGESDSTQSQAYYAAALATLINDRVAAGLMPANSTRVVTQMRVGTALYSAPIAAAKVEYAQAHSTLTRLITMSPYFISDNLHCNARGQLQLGYDAFEAIFNKPHLGV